MKKIQLNFKNKEVTQPTERILNDKTDFNTVETFKTIRTNIMFSIPKTDKGKAIIVTSAAPGEGKTTTSINLAITFAQMGAKVIIIDCDLRKSRVHRYLGVDRENGVSNVLCGFIELDKAIKRNVRENLDCITAGKIPPNPAELIGSEEFAELVSKLCSRYDYVFIDTPPVNVVTDALLAMEHAIGVIVVTRHNVTTFDILDVAIDSIKKGGVKILGVIMLGTLDQKAKKYKYYNEAGGTHKRPYTYGYKYSYRYGYDYMYGDTDKNDTGELDNND